MQPETCTLQEDRQVNKPTVLLDILSVALCVMFPVGLIIMLTSEYNKFLWTTSAFLFIQGITTYLILIKSANVQSAVISALVVLLTAFAIELIGVKTGLPFGNYSYSDILKPQLMGVPLAIPLAWFILVINSVVILQSILPHEFFFIKIFLSAVTVLSFDIMLEPFASFVNKFWIWENNQIPFSNYISWFAAAFILSLAVSYICFRNKTVRDDNRFSYIVLLLNFLNFAVINIFHGYYIYTITGILFLAAVTFSVIKIRALHGV
jgi:putative membrane protein